MVDYRSHRERKAMFWPSLLLAACWLLAMVAPPGFTAEPSSRFRPGDRVVVSVGGRSMPGVVVREAAADVFEIRMDNEGSPSARGSAPTKRWPAAFLRPAAEASSSAPAMSSASAAPPPSTPPMASDETPKPRTWKDASGAHTVEATFVQSVGGNVRLKRSDGRVISLPLERLSEADQSYVRQRTASGRAPVDSPQAEGAAAAPAEQPAAAGEGEFASPDWSGVREIAVGGEPPRWAAMIDGVGRAAAISPRPVAIGHGKQGEADIQCLLFLPESAQAIVARNRVNTRRDNEVQIEWFDLKQGSRVRSQSLPLRTRPVALQPGGQAMLALGDADDSGKSDSLEIWNLSGDPPQRVLRFMPYAREEASKRSIAWAEWVDAGHVLTVSREGRLVLWEVPRARAVYTLPLVHPSRPAVSPGRRHLAVVTAAGLEFYEALTGKLLGRLECEKPLWPVLAYRPDGCQIALASANRLEVWDLALGAKYREIAMPPSGEDARVYWFDDDHLAVEGSFLRLIDLWRYVVLWEYLPPDMQRRQRSTGVMGGYFWYATGDNSRGPQQIVPIRLPDEEAQRVAASLNPETLLAVKPGVQASLIVAVELPPDEQARLRQSLTERLQQNGVKAASGQPLQLVARTSPGRSYEIDYHRFGIGGGSGNSRVRITERKSELAFLLQGEIVWKEESTDRPPMFLSLKPGQSLEQAVAEHSKASPDFFLRTRLPAYVPRPTGKPAYGRSILTDQGTTKPLPYR